MTSRAVGLGMIALLAWFCRGLWNSVKPLPPGLHVTSLSARLAESQVEFIDDTAHRGGILEHELAAVAHAEQVIVLEQCPLSEELAEQIVVRQRRRPNLRVVLITDPRSEAYGGTPAGTLRGLEAAGIIVARTHLSRLRDSNPWFSSPWRLTSRSSNADRRQLLVADDGAGGWTSLVASGGAADRGGVDAVGVEIRGPLARDIVTSELRIAAWSTADDRLPAAPPAASRGVGSIDARFLTEGAIRTALRDAIAVAHGGDSISVVTGAFGDRDMVDAMLRACARGARVQLLLDGDSPGAQAVAAEFMRSDVGNIDVRWRAGLTAARFALIRHGGDVWLNLGSADFTRRSLQDFDLEAAVELRLPAHAGPARAAADFFAGEWSRATAYAAHADESQGTYWRYRFAELTGLMEP